MHSLLYTESEKIEGLIARLSFTGLAFKLTFKHFFLSFSFFSFLSLFTMSKYLLHNVWSLTPNCNENRGKILDGTWTSIIASVSWSDGEDHAVDDNSVGYALLKFLKARDGKQATVKEILEAEVHPKITSREYLGDYLRELKKQGICVQVS